MKVINRKTRLHWTLMSILVLSLILVLLVPDSVEGALDPKSKMKLKNMKMKKLVGWAGWVAGLKMGAIGGLGGGAGLGMAKSGGWGKDSLWTTLSKMNEAKGKAKARQGGYGWGGGEFEQGGQGGHGWGWKGPSKEESIFKHGWDMAKQMFKLKKGLLGAKSEILKAQGHMMSSTGQLLGQLVHSADASGILGLFDQDEGVGGGGGGEGWNEHEEHEPHYYQHSAPQQVKFIPQQYVALVGGYGGGGGGEGGGGGGGLGGWGAEVAGLGGGGGLGGYGGGGAGAGIGSGGGLGGYGGGGGGAVTGGGGGGGLVGYATGGGGGGGVKYGHYDRADEGGFEDEVDQGQYVNNDYGLQESKDVNVGIDSLHPQSSGGYNGVSIGKQQSNDIEIHLVPG